MVCAQQIFELIGDCCEIEIARGTQAQTQQLGIIDECKKFASQRKHVDSVANTHEWANCLRAELSARVEFCVKSETWQCL